VVGALARREAGMSLLAWVILGLFAGSITIGMVKPMGQGVVMDLALGIVGAVVGGWLFNIFDMMGSGGFSLYSLVLAVVGAALLLSAYHVVTINEH